MNIPKLPKWSEDLAYFCGLITGDGSLPNRYFRKSSGKIQKRYEISFVSISLEFIESVYMPLFEKLFEIKPYITVWKGKENRKDLFYCRKESKILYKFLRAYRTNIW